MDPKAAASHSPNVESHADVLPASVPLPLGPASGMQPPGPLFLSAEIGNKINTQVTHHEYL